MRRLVGVFSVVLSLSGCTTFRWSDPQSGVVVTYSSTQDMDASGLLVVVETADGKTIHLELGSVMTRTELDGIVEAAINAALKVYGMP